MEARPQTGWSQKQKANALKFSFPGGGGVLFFCEYENERGGSLHLFAFSTFVLRSHFGDFREAFSKHRLSDVKKHLGAESLFTLDQR